MSGTAWIILYIGWSLLVAWLVVTLIAWDRRRVLHQTLRRTYHLNGMVPHPPVRMTYVVRMKRRLHQ